jgi:hypothetical protein
VWANHGRFSKTGLLFFPRATATGQFLETLTAIWIDTTPAERMELLGPNAGDECCWPSREGRFRAERQSAESPGACERRLPVFQHVAYATQRT